MTGNSLRLATLAALLLWFAGAAHAQSDAPAEPSSGELTDAGQSDAAVPEPTGRAVPTVADSEALPGADGPTIETLTESELGALGLDLAGPRVDTSLHFSGFADFSVFVPIRPRGLPALVQGKRTSLYVGNINLYLSKNLSESFRTMAEVRFTYLPNGGYLLTTQEYPVANTTTFDYVERTSSRWGSIIMQRVYLEWTLHRLLAVRGGQFLTPYGIWNVDHGSPAYIPVHRPYVILTSLFPERQTGFELFGRWNATNDSTIGYHLTLSNGTGPISEYRDLDANKAVGGRAYWEYHGSPTYLRLGASGYYGRDTAVTNSIALKPDGGATTSEQVAVQSDNLALAMDFLLKIAKVHLQVEWVGRQRRYTPQGRVVHSVIGASSTQSGASADRFDWGAYGIAAYHFNWYNITPYVTLEYTRMVMEAFLPDVTFSVLAIQGGLNINPTDTVTFKFEGGHFRYPGGGVFLDAPINSFQFQAAWAF